MPRIMLIVVGLTLAILASKEVECRSLPGSIEGLKISETDFEGLKRSRRSDAGGRKPGKLDPSESHRDNRNIEEIVSNSIANGILCNVENVVPRKRVPCKEGNDYEVEWSPVDNGAANISFYRSVLGLVSRF